MPRSVEDLLPEKPDSRLRIYAWSSPEVAERWRDCLKVGQTTQADVNDRIKQSQGQARVDYTLHVVVPADREDGSAFTDTDVRARLVKKMLGEYEAPEIDPGVDEALRDYIERKKASMPDATH